MAEKAPVEEKEEPKIPPKLKREEPETIKSMVGAVVLVKDPNNQWTPAIVLGDTGGNFKLCAFWDSGQRMGVVDTRLIMDAQPLPLDADEEESARPWAYWRAI